MNYQLIRINMIAGGLYRGINKSNTLIIYGLGAPVPPDNGNLPDAPIIINNGIDIFVPDYIGYGRSDGVFTPMNCIKTFLYLYKEFKKGCIGKNSYLKDRIKLKYQRIIFIGRSFGGTYIPLLPRFNSDINELAVFYPVVDSKSCGSVKGEETNKDFLKSMKYDGYYHLYRGILNNIWKDHLENKDDLSPMDNIKYLKNVKLFIGHGKKDKCVNFSKSVKYFNNISKFYPNNCNFKLVLYPNGDHSDKTTKKAIVDFLKWLKI